MKITKLLGAFCAAAIMAGCASFNTSTKRVGLRGSSVALDVKQRMVISKWRFTENNGHVICAEPSPDALSVASASAALSANQQDRFSADAGASLSESGAMIGIRTQSIQLLRDAMYRLCEGYASGAIDDEEFAAMQRRYQSTMMGLIAIEQLTGPVVASQAMLLSNSRSGAGAPGGDAAVASASANLVKAKETLLTAQSEKEKSKLAWEEAVRKRETAEDNLRKARAKENPDPSEIDTLNSTLNAAKDEERNMHLQYSDKERRLESARKAKSDAASELANAKTLAVTSSGGEGNFSLATKAAADSNESLSNAVSGIVKEINASYLREGCMDLFKKIMSGDASLNDLVEMDRNTSAVSAEKSIKAVEIVKDVMSNCNTILVQEGQRLNAQ